MNDLVNISIGGKWHFYDIVAAAEEAGILKNFYTTIFFQNKGLIESKIAKKFRLANRTSDYFPGSKVVANFIPEIMPKALQKVHILNDGDALKYRCDLFDAWTAKHMKYAPIFHSQDGFCLNTAERMKNEGAYFVCDRGIISATYLKELSEKEYGRYGIKKQYADCSIMERTHSEHMLADKVIVPTETVKSSLVSEGISPDKIRIIPYGVDLSRFKLKKLESRSDRYRVLFAGEISFRKGCHYLLDAWKAMKIPNAELVMIGHVEKEFEIFLSKYSGENYRIIRYIAQNELIEYYRTADLFILPSLAEGSARVIYEAMACGTPVIYTEMAGSIARNNIDGIEIPAFSSEAIEHAIMKLYSEQDMAVQMGLNGFEWVKNYSKENYRRAITEMYRDVLNELESK